MAASSTSPALIDDLNAALVEVTRSLLQYASEAFPWTASGGEHLRRDVLRLATRQHDTIQKLTDEIVERGGLPDYGAFPTDYTSLHFVSVAFLMKQMIANQEGVAKTLLSLGEATRHDAELSHRFWELAAVEGRTLEDLKRLQTK
jgi:hypothetical protein